MECCVGAGNDAAVRPVVKVIVSLREIEDEGEDQFKGLVELHLVKRYRCLVCCGY